MYPSPERPDAPKLVHPDTATPHNLVPDLPITRVEEDSSLDIGPAQSPFTRVGPPVVAEQASPAAADVTAERPIGDETNTNKADPDANKGAALPPPSIPIEDMPREAEVVRPVAQYTVTDRPLPLPDRDPHYHDSGDFNSFLISKGVEGREQTIWTPTRNELGHHHFWCVGRADQTSFLDRNRFLQIENLANSGMRRVFERFGIRSSLEITQDTETHGIPTISRTAELTFPSSTQLQQQVAAFAAETGDPHTDKFGVAPISGKFVGMQQIGELAKGKIVMSVEDSERPVDGTYDLSYYSHDLRLHFPAYTCMPPTITTALTEEAEKAMTEYTQLKHSDDPGTWQEYAASKERISAMTGHIDGLFTTRALVSLLAGKEDGYGERMRELLRRGNPRTYEEQIMAHIENPNMNNVLVARRR